MSERSKLQLAFSELRQLSLALLTFLPRGDKQMDQDLSTPGLVQITLFCYLSTFPPWCGERSTSTPSWHYRDGPSFRPWSRRSSARAIQQTSTASIL